MKVSKSFVATVVIISTLLVLAAVAVIILAVFLTKAASSQTWNSYYRGNFRILNLPYNETLASSSSMEFFELADNIQTQLDLVYSQSELSKEFSRGQVVEFSFGSVKVELVLQFRGNGSIPASLMDAVELAFQRSLTQVDMSTLTGSLNHFLIDINSIQFTEISKSQAESLLNKVSLGGSAALDSTVATSMDVPTQPTSVSLGGSAAPDSTVATSMDIPTQPTSVSLGGSAAPDSTVATSMDVPTQPTSDSTLRTTGVTPDKTVANINISTGTTIGCGIKAPTSSRIVGGTNAANGEWPWQVSLQIWSHVCGASIISDRWLISAAHCFVKRTDPTAWQVYMGSVEVGTGTRRDIRQIIVHPNYAVNNPNDYDVAVLELSSPLSFSSLIQPICLPSSEQVFPTGQQCYITGWGTLTNQGSLASILQEAEVSIIGEQTCRDSYSSGITPRMLCAGVLTGGVDSCQGDSGGPLACSDSRGTWSLAGVVSFGKQCALPNIPGVYARVAAVRDWVEQQTGV